MQPGTGRPPLLGTSAKIQNPKFLLSNPILAHAMGEGTIYSIARLIVLAHAMGEGTIYSIARLIVLGIMITNTTVATMDGKADWPNQEVAEPRSKGHPGEWW
jgi:hypothetical protein